MSLAIVPGSFDPMTLGHLDLVRTASERYDEVVVAVMINAAKQYLFSMEERVRIAKLTVADLSNVRVIGDEGMLIDLFRRLHATAVVKTFRNSEDLAYETEMAEWNRAHCPEFVTELIPAVGCRSDLSATQVRTCLQCGKLPTDLVHPSVLPILKEKIKI